MSRDVLFHLFEDDYIYDIGNKQHETKHGVHSCVILIFDGFLVYIFDSCFMMNLDSC